MSEKPWYASKTIWFNAVAILSAVIASCEDVLPVLPPVALPYLTAIAAVGNIFLRVWFTDTSIRGAR